MSIIKLLDFKPLGDARGSLVSLEEKVDVPFEIKRVYYIFGTKENVSRGFHAHLNLEQVAVCVTGSCSMILDDGFSREEVHLNSSTKGIHIPVNTWREMHNFTPDCVLLVLASALYDEDDYIRDYELFKRGIRK
jgi:dTDP-4-dehydrorhamnose 3,5-epimerase-like enzyme